MITETEQRKETSGRPPIPELGLLIVHARTGKVWMVQDKVDDPSSGRYKGQWTIPSTTLEQDEGLWNGVEKAMAEAFDDVDKEGNDIRKILTNSLFHMRGNSLYAGLSTRYSGNVFELNFAVILYDGPEIETDPFSKDTVENGQWHLPRKFHDANVRPFVRQIGRYAFTGPHTDNLIKYRKRPEDRLPVFREGFSIRASDAGRKI